MNERRDTAAAEQRDTVAARDDRQNAAAAAQNDQQSVPGTTAPADEQRRMPVERGDTRTGDVELLAPDALNDFRGRWERVQVAFVDQPREAVQQAHDLVDEVVDRLTKSFSQQRDGLEGTWSRGENVSTEDLRLALQRYRSFFNRLLST